MRKQIFLWSAIGTFVLTLVLAFENIWLVQQYFILFYTFNASTTIIVLLAGLLGFLIGFFAMLYVFEVRKEKERSELEDEVSQAPASMAEVAPEPEPEEKKPVDDAAPIDDFDEDDEVLG